ncbi:MAG: triose-phosphate isomerase [Prevotellaceae bacterium]|jgi:triosephosphate isomerase|nr:triose-phosphate isomerase [Prevotellaceae bacterium]
MRKKIVAGNWKMNTLVFEGESLAAQVVAKSNEVSGVSLVLAPPFTHLSSVAAGLKTSSVALSAQNCATEDSGAYTGEVSAAMLASVGVQYCILGHSERREYYGETDETLNKKLAVCFKNNLIPIFCVGEKLDERESNRHFEVVKAQLENTLCKLSESDYEKVVVAYEPVWAIGTGKTASPEQAQEMHAFIRKTLAAKFGDKAEATPILYGGSCKPSNAKDIFSKNDVDGGLIGGASLVADDFIAIAKSF